jgi:transcriptional regulator with PAS, ATPase and Fis domain
MKVGSSQIQKTNVRIVAATNVNMAQAIEKGRFREDLYYRLSTVEIALPALRERGEDIHLLFRKFASDFAQKYKMPTIRLNKEAIGLLLKYHWGGNIRQLRNITEQLSVLEQKREIGYQKLQEYLPHVGSHLPAVIPKKKESSDFSSEREILYKVLFDMQKDINDLKKLTLELMNSGNTPEVKTKQAQLIKQIYAQDEQTPELNALNQDLPVEEQAHDVELIDLETQQENTTDKYHFAEDIEEEESLSLHDKELELIRKSLEKYDGKRKEAAQELGISERTLYRKIKQFNL